jgi:hypothetical protein
MHGKNLSADKVQMLSQLSALKSPFNGIAFTILSLPEKQIVCSTIFDKRIFAIVLKYSHIQQQKGNAR